MSRNLPPPHTSRLLDRERFQNAAQAAGWQRVAFLAGPYIETSKKPRKSSRNKASILRHSLFHALEGDGWAVTLGEYLKLYEAAIDLFGSVNNSAIAEIHHARSNDTDAIIMLPSSPGSFMEFGAFSNIRPICEKMIVIVDQEYESATNYMNSGTIKAAKTNHAEVHFIDYTDFDRCWHFVKRFVEVCLHSRNAREATAP